MAWEAMMAQLAAKLWPTVTMLEHARLESSAVSVTSRCWPWCAINLEELVTRAVMVVLVSMYAQLKALDVEMTAMRTHGSSMFWEDLSCSVSSCMFVIDSVAPVLGYHFGTACCCW